MNNKYKVNEIIEAIDLLLDEKNDALKLINEIKDHKQSILKLTNEVKSKKEKSNNIPENTEKIILQAENYLKK
tara:strand:- start:556 stop:774 length:219 start_codon:yes stop_codon:yes gene_type:complete